VIFAVVLSSIAPFNLYAQVSVELGPTVGFYASATDTEGPNANPFSGVATKWKQLPAVAYGGEATVWIGGRIGIGGAYLYSPSDVRNGANSTGHESASVQIATVRATYGFEVGNNRVYLSGGVGRIKRGGSAYEDLNGNEDTAALAGVGNTLRLARHLRINIGVDALFYSLQLKSSTTTFPSHSQVDLVGRVGLVYRLGG